MTKADFLAIRQQRILLDTNIIMKIDDGSKEVREALLAFTGANDVCISDTVMYELLRNLNAKRFRERHDLIRRAGLACLSEGAPAVKAMFERINWLYLSLLRDEPVNFLHRQQNDLWIIAAGLANGIRHFLTTDHSSDFLPQIFTTKTFDLDPKQKICLHEFDNMKASLEWKRLTTDGVCTITLHRGYLNTIKNESWKNRVV